MTHRGGKLERCPIMSILHHFENIPLELDFPVKVRIMEQLHRDFLPLVFTQARRFEVNVMFEGFTRQWDFFIQSTTIFRNHCPISDRQGYQEDGYEYPIGCPSCTEG